MLARCSIPQTARQSLFAHPSLSALATTAISPLELLKILHPWVISRTLRHSMIQSTHLTILHLLLRCKFQGPLAPQPRAGQIHRSSSSFIVSISGVGSNASSRQTRYRTARVPPTLVTNITVMASCTRTVGHSTHIASIFLLHCKAS